MAKPHERVFALMGALVFLLTSAALSIAVIWQATHKNANQTNAANTNTCQDTQVEPVLPAPQVYTTTDPVTSLQKTDLTVGTGQTAKSGDCLVVKYYGTLAKTGAVFDESFTKTTAFAFTVGQGQVIQGWDQGLPGMKVGGVRRLVIPASLAYGNQSPSSAIPANSDLVFVVQLLRIQK